LRSGRLAAVLAAAVLAPAMARAQQQLTATEFSVSGLAAIGGRDFFGLAGAWSRRVDSQTRIAALAAAGSLGGGGAARLEATAQLIVNPSGRGGAGLYAGAGVAWQGGRGSPGHAYVTVLLGLEGAPGARQGWFGEIGLGGGVRLAMGCRWRRFPPWWR
jgi:hypothetical protein